MKKILSVAFFLLCAANVNAATRSITAFPTITPVTDDYFIFSDTSASGAFGRTTLANVKTALGVPAAADLLVGSCTGLPCLDGTSDGGDLIKLYGPGGFWTALQAGNSTANRSWRLPLAAAPSAGTTRLMNMDENGQMGFVDPATFAAALTSDQNYVTDAQVTLLGNTSGTNTGDQTVAASMTFTASGFNGNLLTTTNTVQELADAVDDLTLGGALSLDGLTDVNTAGAANGSIIKYNGTSWVIGVDAGESGGISHAASDGNYYASRNGAWASLTGLYANALGADDNYVTDAEKIVIGNTSGTNTGDQTLPTASSLSVDDLITLSGVATGAVNLGTFTGTTIADSSTVKTALQAVETEVETKADASGISFEAATLSDINILDSTHVTVGTGLDLVLDTMAYGNADDAYHLWTIDKTGSQLALKLNITDIDDTPSDGNTTQPASSNSVFDGLALKLTITDIDDTAVNGETAAPISSNWAYDHVAASDPHTGYVLESAIGTSVQAYDADLVVDAIEFVIDGGGSAITSGVKGFLEVPYGATINRATLLCDQSGSIVVDVWKDTYANYPPTVADTITASAKPTISTATKAQDATLTGWTTSITAGDIVGFNVDSATTVQRCTISLKVAK